MFSKKIIAKIGSIFLIAMFLLTGALPAQQVVAATTETIRMSVDDWAQIYTLAPSLAASIPPDTQQAYLKASNAETDDNFGRYSIALSGDTLVVGVPDEDSNAVGVNGNQVDNSVSRAGAVYVFTRSIGVWSQQAYLKASNPNVDDYFGYSVDISGDTIVVGAFGEDSNATGVNHNQLSNSAVDSGAAYVFTRTGTTWSQQAYLKASNAEEGDVFGQVVRISGDTIAANADYEDSSATGINGNQADNSGTDSGAVYVFTRTGTTWSQQAYVKTSNTVVNDLFGWRSIALSGDTLAVDAYGDMSNATGVNGNATDFSAKFSGAVYILTRTGSTWSQQAYLKASNTGAKDYFGSVVSLSGDTVAVSAYGEDSNATGVNGNQADNSATDSGAVYVFTRTGTAWSQQAYVKASNAEADDLFGRDVSLSGDILAVSSRIESSNAIGVNGDQANNFAPSSGAAYVFTRTGTNWYQHSYLKASNAEAGDYFGNALSLSGDTVVVGAPYESSNATGVNQNQADNSALNSGAAYVFTIAPVFDDVAFSYWANNFVERLAAAGVTGGCGAGIYCPDSTVTRAQMAVFLLKGIHGSSYVPPAVGGSTGFGDVAIDYWSAAWIKQLAAEGITSGCGAGIYCPDATVTRAQMAVFLLKAKNGSGYTPPAVGVSTGFTDVAIDYWAAAFIKQLVTDGITSGCGGGNYCPDADVTRAQMAVFLVKAFNLP